MLVLLLVPTIFVAANGLHVPLVGSGWNLFSSTAAGGKNLSTSNASIPGDVYLSLFEANKIPDPLFRDNDVNLRWISYENWVYERSLNLPNQILTKKAVILQADYLDTICTIFLNGRAVGAAQNLFRTYVYDVTSVARAGENTLRFDFTSSVNYSRLKAAEHRLKYKYSVPLDCHLSVEHGECHANFIRTMQAHFGWDWGPAFPTMGIHGRRLSIEAFDTCFMQSFSVVPLMDTVTKTWILHSEFFLYCASESIPVNFSVSSDELRLNFSWTATSSRKGENIFYRNITLSGDVDVKLWWPNGLGEQKLYRIDGRFSSGDESGDASVNAGFRKIELVQKPVPGFQNGLTFFFNINDVPVFLKGSNWIPGDVFMTRLTRDRLEFYFRSMREANMNCIRVWGGGVYETDEFYSLADQYGITIWHDMMFAVDLYPGDREFLDNVRTEIEQQINRLKYHPSIIVWAGNNENELGLVDGWFPFSAPNTTYIKDYLSLYNDTVYAAINRTDFYSRPYVLSSPSNGIETVMEGGVARNPMDTLYGDIHFYSYFGDAWDWKTYLTPRCVTEFGYQSLPSMETLRKALANDKGEKLKFFDRQMQHRQHHPLGDYELLGQLILQFKFFGASSSPNSTADFMAAVFSNSDLMPPLEDIIYLSQIHQAMAYKTETEHYRRYRSRVNEKGEGLTMCALYWQLNDIWQAPTWSSIDYGLKWKAAHYYAKRFFAPVLVSPYIDGENMKIVLINDLNKAFENVTVILETIAWDQLTPALQFNITVPRLEAVESKMIFDASSDHFLAQNHRRLRRFYSERLGIFYNVRAVDAQGNELSPNNVVFIEKFQQMPVDTYGRVKVENVRMDGKNVFIVKLSTDRVAPFVWLDVAGVRGYFEDNAFTMLRKEAEIRFFSWDDDATLERVTSNLTVKSLGDLYR